MLFSSLSLQISREYNLQVFLHENHVFTDLLQYQFEPQDNDQVGDGATVVDALRRQNSETDKTSKTTQRRMQFDSLQRVVNSAKTHAVDQSLT